jgi:hypothetical protein
LSREEPAEVNYYNCLRHVGYGILVSSILVLVGLPFSFIFGAAGFFIWLSSSLFLAPFVFLHPLLTLLAKAALAGERFVYFVPNMVASFLSVFILFFIAVVATRDAELFEPRNLIFLLGTIPSFIVGLISLPSVSNKSLHRQRVEESTVWVEK